MCDKRLCNCKKATAEPWLQKLEDAFGEFARTASASLLKKHLTREIFDKIKTRKSSYGSSLLDVIQSGLANPDSGVGVYAPDPEAYSTFAELFDPIIEDYHAGFGPGNVHPPLDWGNPVALGNLDPSGKYVLSTRVRCGRSLEGYPFNPTMTKAHYTEIQNKVSNALATLDGELEGTYHPLEGMDKVTQRRLIDEHFLFKEGDRFLQDANACRYWPTGRGIFYNEAKTFLVWCNEEDHLRIISMQKGGDLASVYSRLVEAVSRLVEKFPFARHERLGFLTFCPTNLGTTVRASVHIRLPLLSANYEKFEAVAAMHNLQVRGTRGEHTESEEGIFDISNKRRLGLTEFQALQEMKNGILEIIKQEQLLEQESISQEEPLEQEFMKQEPLEQEFMKQEPLEQEPLEKEPLEQESLEQEPLEQKPLEQELLEQELLEQEPLEQDPLEQEPLEQKPLEREPLEQESSEQESAQ